MQVPGYEEPDVYMVMAFLVDSQKPFGISTL